MNAAVTSKRRENPHVDGMRHLDGSFPPSWSRGSHAVAGNFPSRGEISQRAEAMALRESLEDEPHSTAVSSKSDSRPPKLQVALALAIWAERKPDCYKARKEIDRKHEPFSAITRKGNTGACLLDARGHIVTVEGSNVEHVASRLCFLYPEAIRSGSLVLSRTPCATCVRRLIQCQARVLVLPQHPLEEVDKLETAAIQGLAEKQKNRYFHLLLLNLMEPDHEDLHSQLGLSDLFFSLLICSDSQRAKAKAISAEYARNLPSWCPPKLSSDIRLRTVTNLLASSNIRLAYEPLTNCLPLQILRLYEEQWPKGLVVPIDWICGALELLATRSVREDCNRNQGVACAVLELRDEQTWHEDSSEFRILSLGYNGKPSLVNDSHDAILSLKSRTIHAEENAILNTHRLLQQNHRLFVTHQPCDVCCRLIQSVISLEHVLYVPALCSSKKKEASDKDSKYLMGTKCTPCAMTDKRKAFWTSIRQHSAAYVKGMLSLHITQQSQAQFVTAVIQEIEQIFQDAYADDFALGQFLGTRKFDSLSRWQPVNATQILADLLELKEIRDSMIAGHGFGWQNLVELLAQHHLAVDTRHTVCYRDESLYTCLSHGLNVTREELRKAVAEDLQEKDAVIDIPPTVLYESYALARYFRATKEMSPKVYSDTLMSTSFRGGTLDLHLVARRFAACVTLFRVHHQRSPNLQAMVFQPRQKLTANASTKVVEPLTKEESSVASTPHNHSDGEPTFKGGNTTLPEDLIEVPPSEPVAKAHPTDGTPERESIEREAIVGPLRKASDSPPKSTRRRIRSMASTASTPGLPVNDSDRSISAATVATVEMVLLHGRFVLLRKMEVDPPQFED